MRIFTKGRDYGRKAARQIKHAHIYGLLSLIVATLQMSRRHFVLSDADQSRDVVKMAAITSS